MTILETDEFVVALFADLFLICYERDCQFPFLDGDVPHSTSHVVNISQLIGFARASSHFC